MTVVTQTTSVADVEARIADLLADRLAVSKVRITDFKRHIEGFSWETYSMGVEWEVAGVTRTDGLIVHRQPEVGVLEPYNAERLFELLGNLRALDRFPVAEPLWLDLDGSFLGRPGYVVRRVAGDTPTPWTVKDYFVDDRQRHGVGVQFAHLAADIHATTAVDLPPGFAGTSTADPIEAVIDRWAEQYERNKIESFPAGDYLFGWLRRYRHLASDRVGLVHGDFRVGNFLVEGGRITAMIDWETAHVGDPVEDLACATLKQLRGGRMSEAGGLIDLDEFIETYENRTGWTVPRSAIQYWWVFISTAGVAQWATAMRHFEQGRTRDIRYPTVGYQTFAYPVKDALRNIAALRNGDHPW